MLVDSTNHTRIMNTRKFEVVLGADSTALIKAVAKGKYKLTKILVEGGAHVDTRDGNGRTALVVACMLKPSTQNRNAQLKLVKVLLDHGANPNEADKYGRTPLMYAISGDAGVDILQELLGSDADPRAMDRSGTSALVYAVNAGNTKVLYLLIEFCKRQGKEVIIITDKESSDKSRREIRQYLEIPPAQAKSPAVFEYTGPQRFDYELSHVIDNNESVHRRQSLEVENKTKSGECMLSPEQPSLMIQTPRSVEEQPVLHIQTPSPVSDVLLEVEEGEGSEKISPIAVPSRVHSRRRRKLQRRQSSENFYLEPTNSGSNEGSDNSLYSSGHSMASLRNRSVTNSPEPRPPQGSPNQLGGGPRRHRLPGMPPPLKKSQTVHAIRVSPRLLSNYTASPKREYPEKLLGSRSSVHDAEDSWGSSSSLGDVKLTDSTEGIPLRRGSRSGMTRRDSASMLLDDELSKNRPGVLPSLNRNHDQPIPDIGSPFDSLSLTEKKIFSRLDRRSSIQLEDIGRITRHSPLPRHVGSSSQNDLSHSCQGY